MAVMTLWAHTSMHMALPLFKQHPSLPLSVTHWLAIRNITRGLIVTFGDKSRQVPRPSSPLQTDAQENPYLDAFEIFQTPGL